jgi:cyclopropane-fatty-acyl-phospholipid synthase
MPTTLDRPMVHPESSVLDVDVSITHLPVPASAKAVLSALSGVRGCRIRVVLPDGRRIVLGDPHGVPVRLTINDHRFARRVIFGGDIGLAEGFIHGEWETDDLPTLLTQLARNLDRFPAMHEGGPVGKLINWLRHRLRPNTRSGSKQNILRHYDLGNAFYEAWLDRSMTYSSARFDEGHDDLENAQQAKYRAIAERLQLKPGEQMLEIGCGWGGFAEFAAREYGVHVTGITISDAQFAYARERIARAGLTRQVEIRSQDYRDLSGTFDKVASIEMLEAVGERFWPGYFAKIAQVLRPGGRATLQSITIRDDLFAQYRARADFVQHHVFPGGMLPSLQRLRQETGAAGLSWDGVETFGDCYARTLSEWSRRFVSRWDDIRRMGFDERFRRLWLFYLGYCEAGFQTGRTDVVQIHLRAASAARPVDRAC